MAQNLPDRIGNYRLLEKIGEGGMGPLFRALDPNGGRIVAIKLIRADVEPEAIWARLVREARSVGWTHDNIVRILELSEHEGQPFIVLEYIQGETLDRLVGDRPALPLHRKLQIIDQLCAGLEYAHRMGAVHGDIMPRNIMIDREGTVKILDFGGTRIGDPGVLMGVHNYAAPEVLNGTSVDARADIYSVGAVIYELFAGPSASGGRGPNEEAMYRALHGRPRPLSEVCPGLAPELIVVIDKCLEAKAEARYQNVAALRADVGVARMRLEPTA